MKKYALSALILSAAILVSCGSNAVDTKVTTSPEATNEPVTTTPEYVYPEKDYEGHEFVFLNQDVCGWANRLCVPEETTGELINDAMYERNARISERFNITISEYNTTKGEISELIRSSVLSGDDIYDAAFCPIDNISALMSDGMLLDLSEIGSLKLSEPWWDKNVVSAATINGKCYMASSDITFFPFEATWVLYFNEDRFDALKLEYPYESVRDGKWTLDDMYEICKAGTSLNGQESFRYDENTNVADYGVVSQSQIVQAMMFGGGETFISSENGRPEFDGDSERVYSLFEKIARITGTDGISLDRDKAGAKDTATKTFSRSAFRTGHFMFLSATLGHISGLRDFEGSFGVLPLPKYDEAQDGYHSMIATWGTLMTTIPASSSDPERTGTILDALAYDSYKNLMDPYYNTYLNQKGVRNEDSAEMLRVIRESRVINTGSVFGWTDDLTRAVTEKAENGDFAIASTIAAEKDAISERISKTMALLNE